MPVEQNQHDDEALAAIRRDQEDPIVVYLIVRKSLEMGAGKIAAQSHHAGKILMLRLDELLKKPSQSAEEMALIEITTKYLEHSFRTIVLVASDSQWQKLKDEVRVFIVRDAGLTEVEPGSETLMSTWPMYKSQAPKIIRKLQALK
jgi:PTH2 family peptidyl-tRNA hydrolase